MAGGIVDFYLFALVILLTLAVLDLSVGVANDAVNFLNSAVGARAARLRTLLILAASGLLLGSLLSSGMMEVARSGIFQPASFSFHDVIIVFVAVMLADVLLLDGFNTLGLPTSTTVSVVFELLGAAFVLALIKSIELGQPLSVLSDYLNTAGALRIVGGIFLSVGLAFTVGLGVMWLSRLLFTFRPERYGQTLHLVWSGFALAVIGYFLVVKGLKSSPLMPVAWSNWIATHAALAIGAMALAGALLALLLSRVAGLEPMRLVVLAGTFALATAFASNDLVNFIGVPLAGLAAWQAWSGSGIDPKAFAMDALSAPVQGQTWLLVLGGMIMATTLWLSNKARSVTATEVNLARQSVGHERFRPGPVSRTLLRLSLNLTALLKPLVPGELARRIEQRFERIDPTGIPPDERPAFDLVRGSVNLTVASSLIAIATTMKLPLSTTFVTFMVAMGTSLADRSWGRDSAVYRIAGVASVLAGWLLTALIAFVTAGLFALVLWRFEGVGLAALALLAFATLAVTTRWHTQRATASEASATDGALRERFARLLRDGAELLRRTASAPNGALGARGAAADARRWRHQVQRLEALAIDHAGRAVEPARAALLRLFRLELGATRALERVLVAIETHERNLHAPLSEAQRQRFRAALEATAAALAAAQSAMVTPVVCAKPSFETARARIDELQAHELASLARSTGEEPARATRLLLNAASELGELLHGTSEALQVAAQLDGATAGVDAQRVPSGEPALPA